jgi:hypothetical protein
VRDELGGYAGDNVTADFDLWSRLLRKGSATGHGECLVSYRNHSGSIMGRENAGRDKRSNDGLRRILTWNLQEWGGATAEEAARIAGLWLEPSEIGWPGYFSITGRLAGKGLAPGRSLVSEEDYTLMHRAVSVSPRCAGTMLLAMRQFSPQRYAALPQPRTLVTRLLHGF